jgi:citrate lyase subunit beta/citryl-CoA lyase
MGESTKLLRSWMFVPGHRQKMIDKAFGLANVDAVMLDIEDGVAPNEKEAARQQIASSLDAIATQGDKSRTPARYVRINEVGHERMYADTTAVIRPGLEGLVLPKVDTPEQVEDVEEILDRAEPDQGIVRRAIQLLVAIESPRGLARAAEIAAASPRVIGLIFGAEDFGRELGLPLRREGEARDLLYARSAFICAAAAANVQAVDGVWPNLQDTEGLEAFALQSRRLGFTGMSLIHPSQIDPINAAFSPSADEVEYCRKVVEAFDEARGRGEGSIAFGGQLIDLPIVERARRTLALAASLGQNSV